MTGATQSGSSTVEAGGPSASIIPFPVRPDPVAPDVAVAGPVVSGPEDRLGRALESLNAAMAEQRAAVAGWRDALGELHAAATGLDENLQRYRSRLETLRAGVSALHAKARSLEQWADSVTTD